MTGCKCNLRHLRYNNHLLHINGTYVKASLDRRSRCERESHCVCLSFLRERKREGKQKGWEGGKSWHGGSSMPMMGCLTNVSVGEPQHAEQWCFHYQRKRSGIVLLFMASIQI